jgi:hypothetical protein
MRLENVSNESPKGSNSLAMYGSDAQSGSVRQGLKPRAEGALIKGFSICSRDHSGSA